MIRRHPTLFFFAACVVAVIGALAWVTHHALRLETQQRAGRAEAALQERVRLALWRMDSKAGALLARESARPFFEYQPFFAAERAYTRMLEEVKSGEVLVPSPLLTLDDRLIKLHFQLDDGNELTSPQAPTGNMRDLAESAYLDPAVTIAADQRLHDLATILGVHDPDLVQDQSGEGRLGIRRVDLARQDEAAKDAEYRSNSQTDGDRSEESQRDLAASSPTPAPAPQQQAADPQTTQFTLRQSIDEFKARAENSAAAREYGAQQRGPAKLASKQATPSPDQPSAEPSPAVESTGTGGQQSQAAAGEKSNTNPDTKTEKLDGPLSGFAATGAATTSPIPATTPPDEARKVADTGNATAAPADPTPPPPASAAVPASPPRSATAASRRSSPVPETDAGRPTAPGAISDKAASTTQPQSPSTGAESSPTYAAKRPVNAVRGVREQEASEALRQLEKEQSAPVTRAPAETETREAVEVRPFVAAWANRSAVAPGTLVTNGESGFVPTKNFALTPNELLFIRDVRVGESHRRQGFWIDWPALRSDLLASARDLLPNADVRPVSADPPTSEELARRLASFPAEIVPGALPTLAPAHWSPLRTTLVLAWLGVLLAIAAIASMLRAATDLAERRGRFVSAVTHELRTPLTTFVMYSQMLADGMVPEGQPRQDYYATLKREASRLAGIVESVLEYARLSRKHRRNATSASHAAGPIPATEMIERLNTPLRERAEQAGFSFNVEVWGDRESPTSLDLQNVERILFNLVDNACKYAAGGEEKRIDLKVRINEHEITFNVRDHGAGIPLDDRSRIFKAFERGTRQADGSIPGLGLGLALSKGLAEDMGGSLRLVNAQPAEFELIVKR